MNPVLLQLAALFAMLSMLAFGGGAGVIPDMQRAAVEQYHWLTASEFLDMFAISRAAPGPGRRGAHAPRGTQPRPAGDSQDPASAPRGGSR